MNASTRFNLVIVRARGARVVRLSFGRGALAAALVAFGLTAFALGAVSGGQLSTWRERYRVAGLERLVTEQERFIQSFHRRIADIRSEVASWRQLHHQMWEPFGPKSAAGRKATGVGGPPGLSEATRTSALLPLPEELDLLSSTVADEGKSLRALSQFVVKVGKVFAALPSRWPVRGAINSEFGSRISPWTGTRELHSGLDIDADRGTPVLAPAPGVVVSAGRNGAYGLSVTIDHGNHVTSRYGHLDKIQVAAGQRLERGQSLGLAGNTGRSTGPHLHYEILVKGQPVNPKSFLWE